MNNQDMDGFLLSLPHLVFNAEKENVLEECQVSFIRPIYNLILGLSVLLHSHLNLSVLFTILSWFYQYFFIFILISSVLFTILSWSYQYLFILILILSVLLPSYFGSTVLLHSYLNFIRPL